MRASIRSARNPQVLRAPRIQPSSPAACQVAAIPQEAKESAATQIAGVIGSWRWITSKRSCSSTSRTFVMERGERTMFGSEPLAGTTTERPTGMIPSGSSPWRPLRGWRSRERWPGGSCPMTSLTSWAAHAQ